MITCLVLDIVMELNLDIILDIRILPEFSPSKNTWQTNKIQNIFLSFSFFLLFYQHYYYNSLILLLLLYIILMYSEMYDNAMKFEN